MENYFSIDHIFFEILNYPLSYIEFWGVLTGLIAVYLSSIENVWSWVIGLINVVLFFILFYQVQLYPDMMLQVFYFITNCIGFFLWKFPKKEEENYNKELKISRSSNRSIIIYTSISILATLLLGKFSSHLHEWFPKLFSLPSAFPYIDSFTTVLSIYATFLLMKKKLEAWIVWLIVDIILSIVYLLKDIKLVSIEYIIFCVIAAYGFYHWVKTYRKEIKISE
ncbi:MAG: nicotinamide riboside transporter PnuC [Bacteroidota bacterium]